MSCENKPKRNITEVFTVLDIFNLCSMLMCKEKLISRNKQQCRNIIIYNCLRTSTLFLMSILSERRKQYSKQYKTINSHFKIDRFPRKSFKLQYINLHCSLY